MALSRLILDRHHPPPDICTQESQAATRFHAATRSAVCAAPLLTARPSLALQSTIPSGEGRTHAAVYGTASAKSTFAERAASAGSGTGRSAVNFSRLVTSAPPALRARKNSFPCSSSTDMGCSPRWPLSSSWAKGSAAGAAEPSREPSTQPLVAAMEGPEASAGGATTIPPGFVDFNFPHASSAVQGFMQSLLTSAAKPLAGHLLPSRTPADVRSFCGGKGGVEGSCGFVTLYPGIQREVVDRALVSWLYCPLPFATLAFATLAVLMGPRSDTPHLLLEFTFSGPHATAATLPQSRNGERESKAGEGGGAEEAGEGSPEFDKMIAVMDLLPRRDVVAHPDYMHSVYEGTGLAKLWTETSGDKRFTRYSAPTPFVRSILSPTSLLFSTSNDVEATSKHELLAQEEDVGDAPEPNSSSLIDAFSPLAKQLVDVWGQQFTDRVCGVRDGGLLDDEDVERIRARDVNLFRYGIEADLTRNLPRVFGQDVTARVIRAVNAP